MRVALFAAVVLPIWMLVPPADAQTSDTVSITVEASEPQLVLGESLDLVVTVTNNSSMMLSSGVAHLDVTDPTQVRSVDPEDWTTKLSIPMGDLAPGRQVTIGWSLRPIAAGTFAAYVAVLTPGSDNIWISRAVSIEVTDHRSLNPGGILPTTIGVPALVGALLLFQVLRNRRRRASV